MGHKSKKSLVHQVKETLQTKLHAGESKHLDKQKTQGLSVLLMEQQNS